MEYKNFTAFDGTITNLEKAKLKLKKKSKIESPADLAKIAAPKGAQVLYNIIRVGPQVILRSAFELLRANTITRVLSAVVLLSIDTVSLIRGSISRKQYVLNVVLAAMLMVGGTLGWVLGSEAAGFILIESAVIGIAAGLIGAGVFGAVLAIIWERLISYVFKDDAADMMDILNNSYAKLAEEYLLNEDEIAFVNSRLIINSHVIKKIFISADREKYAYDFIKPCVREVVAKRA